uniref:Transmembrane protein 200A n=1 Tax=Acanthochromis polyacanthus TaxID=80966 RepID=A0A3Q1G952_9TELE
MTAAAGVLTGLAKLKRQDSARSQHRPISAASGKRKRRTDVVVVRGRLRLYSASGFFLLLGLVILAIGIGMATLGYWPHSKSVPTGGGRGGVLMRFLDQHLHSERMKMLGPFTMGIGIFIFICANAILHENRDRETKIIHMRDMYSTVIDIHRLRQKELKQNHHRNSTCAREAIDIRAFGADTAARLASNSLLAFSTRPGGITGSTEEEEVLLEDEELQRCKEQVKLDCSFAGLLAPLYKDRSYCSAGLGLTHSDSMRHQWSVDGDGEKGGHHARSIVSSSISAFTLPVIKLNNCVIDEPEMEAITEEDRGAERRDGERPPPLSSMESLVVPVATVTKASKPPGLHRSNSASSSSRCSSFSSSSLSPAPSSTSGCWLSPGAARNDFGSNSSLHMLNSHSKSLDLERGPSMLSVHPEQRKHPSWPRLDRSSSKGYVRLEDREEQGDRLLDASQSATARRDYSKREKLLMISRSHNNLSFEHDEFNSSTLKRGSSETRF